ncbi:MAG: hypothetical protein NT098_01735 [Candidatus Parcubacteria bacterium]|nr:hypothetical protein [Candidatus Parcubacteria bacterium]
MENEILERLSKDEEKLDKILVSVEKTRKYIFWTMVITVVFLVLPLVGLIFAIPSFISTYSAIGGM